MGRKKKIKAARRKQREFTEKVRDNARHIYDRVGGMSIFDLSVELSEMGVKTTGKDAFKALIPEDYSADEKPVLDAWRREIGRELELEESVFLHASALKFWMSWCPEKPSDLFLEISFGEGYECWDSGDDRGAVEHWTRLMILLGRLFENPDTLLKNVKRVETLLGDEWFDWIDDYFLVAEHTIPPENFLKIEIELNAIETKLDQAYLEIDGVRIEDFLPTLTELPEERR